MEKSTLQALEIALKSKPAAQKKLADAARLIVNGFFERRTSFEQKKKAIEDDIKHGARLTNHRLPL